MLPRLPSLASLLVDKLTLAEGVGTSSRVGPQRSCCWGLQSSVLGRRHGRATSEWVGSRALGLKCLRLGLGLRDLGDLGNLGDGLGGSLIIVGLCHREAFSEWVCVLPL